MTHPLNAYSGRTAFSKAQHDKQTRSFGYTANSDDEDQHMDEALTSLEERGLVEVEHWPSHLSNEATFQWLYDVFQTESKKCPWRLVWDAKRQQAKRIFLPPGRTPTVVVGGPQWDVIFHDMVKNGKLPGAESGYDVVGPLQLTTTSNLKYFAQRLFVKEGDFAGDNKRPREF